MNVYAIILRKPSEKLWESLSQKWGKRCFVLSDRIAFFAPKDITLLEEVRDMAGLDDTTKRSGIVIELSYDFIDGWESERLWEWLRKYARQ